MKKIIFLLVGLFLYGFEVPNEFVDFDKEFNKNFDTNLTYKKFIVNGKIKIRYYRFLKHIHNPNLSDRKNFIDTLMELSLKYHKNDIDNYNATLFFMGGNFSDTYKTNGVFLEEFRDMQRKVPIIGIKEAYLLHNYNNSDFIVGKRLYLNSTSMIYSPSDIFNLYISPDPLEPYKIGSWQIRYDYYKDNARYTLAFFPFFSYPKSVSDKSRWGTDYEYSNNDVNNSDDNVQIVIDNIQIKKTINLFFGSITIPISIPIIRIIQENDNNTTKTFNFIFKKSNKLRGVIGYRNSINGYDITSNFGVGVSPYPIIIKGDRPNDYKITYPPTVFFSLGFSTTFDKLELHSEAYYQNVYDNQDDDYISAVIGGKYTLSKWVDKLNLKQLDIILEYAKEIVVDSENNSKVVLSSRDYRLFKNDIFLKLKGKINYKWSLDYFTNFRLFYHKGDKDSGSYQKIGTTFKPKDGLELGLYCELFNGQENNYYGRWKKNDRIITQIKYNF